MVRSQHEKAVAFRELHEGEPFLFPMQLQAVGDTVWAGVVSVRDSAGAMREIGFSSCATESCACSPPAGLAMVTGSVLGWDLLQQPYRMARGAVGPELAAFIPVAIYMFGIWLAMYYLWKKRWIIKI